MALNDMETTASPDDPCDLSYNLLNKLVSILKSKLLECVSMCIPLYVCGCNGNVDLFECWPIMYLCTVQLGTNC